MAKVNYQNMPFGRRLRRARGAESISYVAKKAGVHFNTWGKWERGGTDADRILDQLTRMVKAVGGRVYIHFPGE